MEEMQVKTRTRFMEFTIQTVGKTFKKRVAKTIMELEADGKWHHCKTTYRHETEQMEDNLADMIFAGKVAEEVIKIKEQLNNG